MFVRLKRQLHMSVVIGWGSAAVVCGVALAAVVEWRWFVSVAWLFVACVLLGLALWRRTGLFVVLAVFAGVICGMWRGALVQQQLSVYDNLVGKTVTLRGVVAEDADVSARGQLVVRLAAVQIEGHETGGQVWVALDRKADIRRSDVVTVRGKLSDGFGAFSVAVYSPELISVQRPAPGDVALRVRDWFAGAVRQVIPEPQASLGLGFLLGQRRGLPPDLMQALQVAGLTHIIVASGYNLTILVRFARRWLEKTSKYLAALSATAMIVSFVAITGLSPSMSRAGLVAGLSLLAWWYGRKFHPLVLLSFAAAITLIIHPAYAWGDLGWLLSFAAFAGVMILAPLLQAYFFGDAPPGTIRQILGDTIAAQLVTLPIIVMAFGTVSNVALIANVLILPLVPLAMVLVAVAGTASLLVPWVGTIVGLPATWLLGYMTTTAEWLASMSWAQSQLTLTPLGVIAVYVLLVAVILYMQRVTRLDLRATSIVD